MIMVKNSNDNKKKDVSNTRKTDEERAILPAAEEQMWPCAQSPLSRGLQMAMIRKLRSRVE